jgi:hypothetical protein
MKKAYLFILCALFIDSLYAQNPYFDWVKQYEGPNSSHDRTTGIEIDAVGNVYTIGVFTGTVDFDPSANTFNLTATSFYNNCYITKMDANGNFIWAKSFVGVRDVIPKDIAISSSGEVYTIGDFGNAVYTATIDFDPGMGTAFLTSSVGGGDLFISKLDANGNYLWAKKIGSGGNDYGNTISLDANGNIIAAGSYWGTVDFDPNAGIANLVSSYFDAFLLKLDISGNYIWAKSFSAGNIANSNSSVDAIKINALGDIYVSGHFGGLVDFDPDAGVNTLFSTYGTSSSYIVKLNSNGNFVFVKPIIAIAQVFSNDIAIDIAGNIFVTGNFAGTVDFDPGPLTQNETGSYSIFMLKLNSSGDFQWVRTFGNGGNDGGVSIQTDALGNVYLGCNFSNTIDFDPGPGVQNLSTNALNEMAIAKYDGNGNYIWARELGGTGSPTLAEIRLASNAIYIAGSFEGIVDFDPNGSVVNKIAPHPYKDAFVLKLVECDNLYTINVLQAACNSYYWSEKDTTYTQSGIYSHFSNCQTTVLFLTVLNYMTDVYVTACDSYYWEVNPQNNNLAYTESGVYEYVNFIDNFGCHHGTRLHLTIVPTVQINSYVTACDSYTWPVNGQTYTQSGVYSQQVGNGNPNCELMILNLTINNSINNIVPVNICAPNSYTWPVNGQTYNVSGNYTYTVPNQYGCDSTTTLLLSVYALPVVSASNVIACPNVPVILIGSPPGIGGSFSVANPYLGPNTSYTYTFTDLFTGCSATSAPATITNSVMSPASIIQPIQVGTTSATVSWTPVQGATIYFLWYRPVGAVNWFTPSTAGTSLVLTGLIPNTMYECKIRNNNANCNQFGSFGPIQNFTTLNGLCATATTFITPFTTSSTTALLNWNGILNVAQYNVWYKKSVDASWFTLMFGGATTQFLLTGLTPNTMYDVRIRNRCNGDPTFSPFGPTYTFGTPPRNGNGDLAIEPLIKVFPNPTTDELFIELNLDKSERVEFKLLDITGKLLKEMNTDAIMGLNSINMRMNEFAKGIYSLRIHFPSSNASVVKKITKVE